jgi:hypothetical protein
MIDIATTQVSPTAAALAARSTTRPATWLGCGAVSSTTVSTAFGATKVRMDHTANAFHPARRRTERSSP